MMVTNVRGYMDPKERSVAFEVSYSVQDSVRQNGDDTPSSPGYTFLAYHDGISWICGKS